MHSKPVTMNVEFINPFIGAVIETMRLQCSVQITPAIACLRKNFKGDYPVDIMGVIGLTSSSFTGSIALCFPATTFLSIMEKMLGEKFPTITEEVKDGAAELLNIVFGMAKSKLNAANHHIVQALPAVIHGDEIGRKQMSSEATIVLPFSSEAGLLHLEIGLNRP